jgi:signal transduction histidine kinase
VKVELSVVERSLESGTRSSHPLADARVMVDRALQTVRDLSQLLHPPMLDDLGLAATLEWFLVSFSKRTGIAAELDQDEEDADRLVPELEMCLYRIVQEATTNVVRHAEAHTCRVSLQRSGARLRLAIEDDGHGFDPADVLTSVGRSGLGLLGMQERVAGFGGTFGVDSAAGRGTRVVADVPRLLRPTPEEIEAGDAPDGRAPSAEGATDVPASSRR